LQPLIQQAKMLSQKYDAVVANPPYMGSKFYSRDLKLFVTRTYKDSKADLYACFLQRNTQSTASSCYHGMINIPNWMFLSSFEELRRFLLKTQDIHTFIHNGRGVFGSDFGSCAFVVRKTHFPEYRGSYRKLFEKQGSVASNEELERRFHTSKTYTRSSADFAMIPGNPVAYWMTPQEFNAFGSGDSFASIGHPRVGMQTSNNGKYLRLWWEIVFEELVNRSKHQNKWIKYVKGGGFRRWAGNVEHVLHYNNRPEYILQQPNAQVMPLDTLEKPKGTWGSVTSSRFSCRLAPVDSFHDIGGHCFYPDDGQMYRLLTLLNSIVAERLLGVINPTLNYQVGDIGRLPIVTNDFDHHRRGQELTRLSESDWDAYERSWNFQRLPLLAADPDASPRTLETSYAAWVAGNRQSIAETKRLEEKNNRLFIDAYGLTGELMPDVPIDQITLTVNPAYRYGHKLADDEWSVEHGFGEDLEARFRTDTYEEMISYAIGCMMGRYSLDKEGLVYAHSGNEGFDPSQYTKFPADEDGIVPVTEAPWFDDDAANRFERFVKTVWPADTLDENLAFVAASLGAKKSETARETIRRYFAGDFYKHHLQTYKNRPIYWLFRSGKQGAFEALVYLHRYNEGTLSRMRTEYVVPLLGKMNGRIGMLADIIATATSTKQRKDAEKEKDKLTKQLAELQAFDEQLNHFASQRITLDLDDGVKVNYGKFGDLLADVKKVCGTKEED